MAGSKATIITLLGDGGDVVNYTVADGTSISKGTIMKITDNSTIAASSANSDPFAGVLVSDKVANDGQTNCGVYTHGIFGMKCDGGAITVGQSVAISGADIIRVSAAGDFVTGSAIGKANATAVVNVAEVIPVIIGIGGG